MKCHTTFRIKYNKLQILWWNGMPSWWTRLIKIIHHNNCNLYSTKLKLREISLACEMTHLFKNVMYTFSFYSSKVKSYSNLKPTFCKDILPSQQYIVILRSILWTELWELDCNFNLIWGIAVLFTLRNMIM